MKNGVVGVHHVHESIQKGGQDKNHGFHHRLPLVGGIIVLGIVATVATVSIISHISKREDNMAQKVVHMDPKTAKKELQKRIQEDWRKKREKKPLKKSHFEPTEKMYDEFLQSLE